MSAPIPVLLLTGYLGAGKTTVLNRLLNAPSIRKRDPALIINEFGPLGVDGKLLRDGGVPTYEINSGSLFCSCTQATLIEALQRIVREGRTGIVLIEATGIAQTSALLGSLAIPSLGSHFALQANLCLVDALNFTKVAPFLPVAADQVRWADGILITKTDLVSGAEVERLREILRDMNPDAPQLDAPFGANAETFFERLAHVECDAPPATRPPQEIYAFAVKTNRFVDRAWFLATLDRFAPHILRLKGNVEFSGEGRRFVEVVGGATLEKPAAEGLPPGSAFTVIAWRIPRAELQAALDPDHSGRVSS